MSKGFVLAGDNGEIINGIALLASIPSGVDLAATGQTTLFTVPDGKTLIITEVVQLITAASSVSGAPAIRIGKASGYNQWLPLTTLTGVNAANQMTLLASAAVSLVRQAFVGGEVVAVDVQTAILSGSMTAVYYLFGYLI